MAFILLILSFVSTLIFVWIVKRTVSSMSIVDKPNERSSHSIPTPHGGGIGLLLTVLMGFFLLASYELISDKFQFVVIFGSLIVSAVSLWDDLNDLPPILRLGVQLTVSTISTYILTESFTQPENMLILPIFFGLLSILAIVWSINLFNFMDGIDGIAGVEVASIGIAIIAASYFKDAEEWNAIGSLMVGSSMAFLVFNWQPASIFMGDVGSAFLGYFIAVIALQSIVGSFVGSTFWVVIYGVFIVDTGVTLFRRLMRGKNPMRAHREHAYQWLSRRVASHAWVSIGVALITLFWLLPLALYSEFQADSAYLKAGVVLIAYTPLVILTWRLGAGQSEAEAVK